MPTIDLDALTESFLAFHARFAPYFYRAEVRERSARYLRALVSPVPRKNGWQLAEAIGDPDPNGVQRLLARARWDEDAVRDELARFVFATFGDPVQGIFVLDETGFLKKGTHSVGVARQYSGTAGKIENCQLGVLLAYVGVEGTAFLDRRLYLPQHWATDRPRRAAAHVPETITFQTKTQLGQAMLAHAWSLGVRGGWVTGDEVYGRDGALRRWLTQQGQPSVLAVPSSEHVWVIDGDVRQEATVAAVAAGMAADAWQRLSCGDGAKGPRWYDWGWVRVAGLVRAAWGHWLLVRRSLSDPTALAYYLVAAPLEITLAQVVRVAGARWGIEQALEEAKGEAGLDEYEVRTWRSWQRHITLSLVAHACLVWLRQTDPAAAGPSGGRDRRGGRPDRPDGAGDAPLAGPDAGLAASGGPLPSQLVGLAPTASGRRQAGALPPPHSATRSRPASLI
jgi:SRSO17 transposase